MSDKQFKTPRTPISSKRSDSEDSLSDHGDCNSNSSSENGLSILAQFDDLMRSIDILLEDDLEGTFCRFIEQTKILYDMYAAAAAASKHFQECLEEKDKKCSELERNLVKARNLLDASKKECQNVVKERDNLELQIVRARKILFRSKEQIVPDETKEKLQFLNTAGPNEWEINDSECHLSAIPEINSTGSILSDFSCSKSEDELDVWTQNWKKYRPSTGGGEPASKKRRSSGHKVVEIPHSDVVRATTTLRVEKHGPITATSVIESIPKASAQPEAPSEVQNKPETAPSAPPADLVFQSWNLNSPYKSAERNNNVRPHSLHNKTMVVPETCGVCSNRIGFARIAVRCKECKVTCHTECKDKLPLPCIPIINTPNSRNATGFIQDYTPSTPPMVPALIIHCVNEIELKGLEELGIYRIPGSERDVKALKEKFLKGKCAPALSGVDIHVICGVVKDFLRSFNEPLVTYASWKDFINAVQCSDPQDMVPALYQAISGLPQPNRDTLAYMMVHLQKVSRSPACHMPVMNLAKVFGPTIVGYSSDNINPNQLMRETEMQVRVMEQLINLPSDYWESFINVSTSNITGKLQQTPSTDSLLRQKAKPLFIPSRRTPKAKRFFATPPHR